MFGQSQQPPPQNDDYPISGTDVLRVILATLLILFAGAVLVTFIGILIMSRSGEALSAKDIATLAEGGMASLPISLKAMAMIVQGLLVVPVFLFLRNRGLSYRTHLRLHGVPPTLILLSLGIGLTVSILGDELGRLMDFVLPMPADMLMGIERLMKLNSLGDFLTIGITVALIAPIGEEVLFRGFFQRYFETRRGVTSGVLVASALFAVYHFNVYWLIPILLMATVMGAMAWRTESILPPILVHAANNSAGLIAANLYSETPDWYEAGGHVSPLVLLPCLVLLIVMLRAFFRKSEEIGIGGRSPRSDLGSKINEVV